ncbi:unnamed protein product [Heterobilharzia americana]|nr:unnamed protein product [Heterobilharzia americana]
MERRPQLPPLLFSFVLDALMNIKLGSLEFTMTGLHHGGYLVDLEYTDDIVLLGEDVDEMSFLNTSSRNLSMFDMLLTPIKCKMMLQDWCAGTSSLGIWSEMVGYVNYFMYLRSYVSWLLTKSQLG